MKCPTCGAWAEVLETRKHPEYTRRRYECANKHRFTTQERVVNNKPKEKEPAK